MAAIALPAGKTTALLGRDSEGHLHLLVALGRHLDPSWVGTLKARSIQSSVRDLQISNRSARRFIDVEFNAPDPLKFGAPFLGFVEHFVDRVRSSATDDIKLLWITFEEWKRAWSQEQRAFTEEWARGLFAELAFLDAAIDRAGSGCAHAWRGPDAPQDFSQKKISFEVKSSATVPHRPVISSIDQLDDEPFEALYLVCVLLERSESGDSLNHIVSRIRKKLTADTASLTHFDDILKGFGYSQETLNSLPSFLFRTGEMDVFRINRSFPKVARASFRAALDERILSLTYRLTLTNLQSLTLDDPSVRGNLKKLRPTSSARTRRQ